MRNGSGNGRSSIHDGRVEHADAQEDGKTAKAKVATMGGRCSVEHADAQEDGKTAKAKVANGRQV